MSTFVAPSYLKPAPAIQGSYMTVWVPAGGVPPHSPYLGAATASAPQRGNIAYNQIRGSSRQGDGSRLQMFGGSLAPTAGNVAVYDSAGNVVDGGSLTNLPLRTTPISTTLTAADYTVIATTPAITVTLPSGAIAGKVYNVKNGNSTVGQTITVTSTGGVLIDQASSLTLGATASLSVQWDGTQWRIL